MQTLGGKLDVQQGDDRVHGKEREARKSWGCGQNSTGRCKSRHRQFLFNPTLYIIVAKQALPSPWFVPDFPHLRRRPWGPKECARRSLQVAIALPVALAHDRGLWITIFLLLTPSESKPAPRQVPESKRPGSLLGGLVPDRSHRVRDYEACLCAYLFAGITLTIDNHNLEHQKFQNFTTCP